MKDKHQITSEGKFGNGDNFTLDASVFLKCNN